MKKILILPTLLLLAACEKPQYEHHDLICNNANIVINDIKVYSKKVYLTVQDKTIKFKFIDKEDDTNKVYAGDINNETIFLRTTINPETNLISYATAKSMQVFENCYQLSPNFVMIEQFPISENNK